MYEERCNCGYRITSTTIPQAGNAFWNEMGYTTVDKHQRKGIGFRFAGKVMCPHCYSKMCKTFAVDRVD